MAGLARLVGQPTHPPRDQRCVFVFDPCFRLLRAVRDRLWCIQVRTTAVVVLLGYSCLGVPLLRVQLHLRCLTSGGQERSEHEQDTGSVWCCRMVMYVL